MEWNGGVSPEAIHLARRLKYAELLAGSAESYRPVSVVIKPTIMVVALQTGGIGPD